MLLLALEMWPVEKMSTEISRRKNIAIPNVVSGENYKSEQLIFCQLLSASQTLDTTLTNIAHGHDCSTLETNIPLRSNLAYFAGSTLNDFGAPFAGDHRGQLKAVMANSSKMLFI